MFHPFASNLALPGPPSSPRQLTNLQRRSRRQTEEPIAAPRTLIKSAILYQPSTNRGGCENRDPRPPH
jgi:hypothetical protein